MNTNNLKSKDQPVFSPAEFGAALFEKRRKEWMAKNQEKKPLPLNYAQEEYVDEDLREEIYEIIEQTKPPYESFEKYIKLSDMVECLNEVWENEDS